MRKPVNGDPKRGLAAFLMAAAFVLAGLLGVPRSAAAGPAPPAGATPSPTVATLPTATVPDVQIVVSPDPMTGQWVVAAVYPGTVTKDKALGRARALIALTGWKAHDLTFENSALHREKMDGVPAAPTMSSVSFETQGNVVDWRAGTVALEPIIRSCQDLTHLNVLYMIPGSFPFHGLRRYSDANVDVSLASGRGAYAYAIVVKNHTAGALHLPVTETDTRAAVNAPPASARGRSLAVAAVVGAALLAAALAFWGVRRWSERSTP